MKTELDIIDQRYGSALATFAAANCAGWVIEHMADTRPNPRGPWEGHLVSDAFLAGHPEYAKLVTVDASLHAVWRAACHKLEIQQHALWG